MGYIRGVRYYAPRTNFTKPHYACHHIFRLTKVTQQTCEGQALKAQIDRGASELKCKGYKVTLRWIPSYKKIEENEQADKAAKQVAMNGRVKTERWSLLSHIRTKIKKLSKKELNQWHYLKEDERHTTRRGWIVTCMKIEIDSTPGKTQKKYAA